MSKFILAVVIFFGLGATPPIFAHPQLSSKANVSDQVRTVYYIYYRQDPQDKWEFWAGFETLKEAKEAEYEVQNYGYETFIKKVEVED